MAVLLMLDLARLNRQIFLQVPEAKAWIAKNQELLGLAVR